MLKPIVEEGFSMMSFNVKCVFYSVSTEFVITQIKPFTIKIGSGMGIVACFEKWVKEYKQLDCDKNSDYYHLRNTLRKWGEINPDTMLHKLNTENYCPKTYNQRLSLLNSFSSWMLKQGFWSINPFDGVSRRKVKKTKKGIVKIQAFLSCDSHLKTSNNY